MRGATVHGRGQVAGLVAGMVAFVAATMAPVVTASAQQPAPWSLSLTVTKTLEGEGLTEFIAANPLFEFLLTQDYVVTATCQASAVTPDGPTARAVATGGINLPDKDSEGSATVTLGAGQQATIPITVEDPTEVDAVACTIVEKPFAVPAVAPGVTCHG